MGPVSKLNNANVLGFYQHFCFQTEPAAPSIPSNTQSQWCPAWPSQGCLSQVREKGLLFFQGTCVRHAAPAPTALLGKDASVASRSPQLPSQGDFAPGHSCNSSPLPRRTSLCPQVNLKEPSHWERRAWAALWEHSEERKIKISGKCLLACNTRCLNTDLLPCCRLPAGRLSSG